MLIRHLDGGPIGTSPSTPLSRERGGCPLRFATITRAIKQGARSLRLDADSFTSHSLRSGGATALLAAGYDIEFVKVMGRWSSDAWRLYMRLDISTRQNIARAMQFAAKERTPSMFANLIIDGDELHALARRAGRLRH